MNERRTDFELLRDFIRHGDQEAFTDVVRRHIDLVYATALRKVENEGAAEEVAQNVFATLACKAWQFAPDDSLPAWLYRATLLEARKWWRGELRRRRREQTAAELGTTMKTSPEQSAFRVLVPLLDEALLLLREKDRAALLLRFYESQSLRDVSASLGVGEDAAQKRVAGALEKLSRFFQRSGFKSATVAAAAAALQQTARSAPAMVVGSLTKAAMQMTPPAMVGLAGWLARLASLTKAQTAAVCLSLAALPVAWQWNDYQRATDAAVQVRAQFAAAQTEQAALEAELDRLRKTVERLEVSSASAKKLAEQRAEAARKFEAWKKHLRGLLTADNYRWPEDSPFVRIPKSGVRQINVGEPVAPPGVLKQQEREFLGLTPQEREQIENTLHHYFAGFDALIDANIYETNRPAVVRVPASALASEVWLVPALGDEVKVRGDDLQAALRATLGEERWPFVEKQLSSGGVNELRRILNLDAGQLRQEVAVWIQDNGILSVGFGWSDGSASFSTTGVGQSLFLSGSDLKRGINYSEYLGVGSLPVALTQRMQDWIGQEAIARLRKESGR